MTQVTVDLKKLRETLECLIEALSFYANGEHIADLDRWEHAQAQPDNWLAPYGEGGNENPLMIENGSWAGINLAVIQINPLIKELGFFPESNDGNSHE